MASAGAMRGGERRISTRIPTRLGPRSTGTQIAHVGAVRALPLPILSIVVVLTGLGCAPGPHEPAGAPDPTRGKADHGSGHVLPLHRVIARAPEGQPTFVEGSLGSNEQEALAHVRSIFGLSDVDLLEPTADRTDPEGNRHLYLRQFAVSPDTPTGRRAVEGGDLTLHFDLDGKAYAASGTARSVASVPRVAAVDEATAAHVAERWGSERYGSAMVESPHLPLVYRITPAGQAHLAFRVIVTGTHAGNPVRDAVYVDARRGTVVDAEPRLHALRMEVYDAEGRDDVTSDPGVLLRSGEQGAGDDPRADALFETLSRAYGALVSLAGDDPLEGELPILRASVGVGENRAGAWWNPDAQQLLFGDGDGERMGSLTRSVDVVCHEITHAVTERTAGLLYRGESGAVNEVVSDVMAAACELHDLAATGRAFSDADWRRAFMIGEDAFTPGVDGDALRYMHAPRRDERSIDHYSRYRDLGVHLTSGIGNLAFTLMARGGLHPEGGRRYRPYRVPPMQGVFLFDTRGEQPVRPVEGWELAAMVFHRALQHYLTPNADYAMLRAATLRAVTDLGFAAEYDSVAAAWDAVGVHDPVPVLEPGTPHPDLAGDPRTPRPFVLEVPEGTTLLTVGLSGGEGDADLWLRPGFPLSPLDPESARDEAFVSEAPGHAEEVVRIRDPEPGRWHVLVRGRPGGYAGTTLHATLEGDPCAQSGKLVPGIARVVCPTPETREASFEVEVGPDTGSLVVSLAPQATDDLFADLDLLARLGEAPASDTAERSSRSPGSHESLVVGPEPGTWHVLVTATEPPISATQYELRLDPHLP